jgi:ribosomal protein S6
MIVDVEPKVINSYSSFVGRNDNVLRWLVEKISKDNSKKIK